ncbi:KR domain-containing protein [Streptomyces sp. HPF1205]|uniref:KR domain-containing protein n=1 Tax=Streptomyces sp. HPF1205 TaxID=2873262 RepID=UPI001CED3D1F|nr:KR domain-containing protein [Streptomyces sp. HPF1205]
MTQPISTQSGSTRASFASRRLDVHGEHLVTTVLPSGGAYAWEVSGEVGSPLAEAVRGASVPASPPALAVVLGRDYEPAADAALLDAVARARSCGLPVALLHEGAGGVSLLRAAALEVRGLRFGSVEVAARTPRALSAAPAAAAASLESAALGGPGQRREVLVDARGRTLTGQWRPVELPASTPPSTAGRAAAPVLVTGGLGGLGLRAAAAVAAAAGVRVLLLDSRGPGELTAGEQRLLSRLRAGARAGADVLTADVTDPRAVARALDRAGGTAPSVLVHCAGSVAGGLVADARPEDLARLRAAKSQGLRTVLAHLDRGALRCLVAFGSVTSRRVHPGMGGYALANEVLRRTALRVAGGLPGCAVVVAEWSLWSGAGEAHRMGVVKDAARQGMPAVPLRPGMDALLRMLRRPAGPEHAAALVVTGAGDRGFPEPGAAAPGR